MKFRTQGPMTMSEAIELVRRYEKRGKIAYKELECSIRRLSWLSLRSHPTIRTFAVCALRPAGDSESFYLTSNKPSHHRCQNLKHAPSVAHLSCLCEQVRKSVQSIAPVFRGEKIIKKTNLKRRLRKSARHQSGSGSTAKRINQ